MSNYKRPNFDGDWWEKVEEYLREHPEEGFQEEDVKQFIKAVVNQHMHDDLSTFDTDTFMKNFKEEIKD